MYKAIILNKIRSVKEKRASAAASGEGKYIFPANTIKEYCDTLFYLTRFLNKVKALHLQVFAKTVRKLVIFPRIILNVNFTSKLVLMMVNPHIAWSFKSCLLTFFDPKVGTSGKKRKQSDNVKRDKKAAKRRKTATTDNEDTCKRCHENGHKSARSPNCKYHISSKQEVFNRNLGQEYQPFTRKLPMDKCVTNQYVNTLKPIIISACRDVRNIVFRAQIFTNYYITLRSQQELNNDIPHCIFRQQFWYSVCQLVNAKRVTTSTNMPPNMVAVWNVFQSQYNSIVYHQQIAGGTSQCLAEACTELATSYHNNMVEHFESRLLYFLYYRLQNIFMVSDGYKNCIFFF